MPSGPKRSVWRRRQLLATGAVFVLATVIGVDVGLHGAAVSPVAPVAVAAATPAAPLAEDQTPTVTGPFDGGLGQADAGQLGGGGQGGPRGSGQGRGGR